MSVTPLLNDMPNGPEENTSGVTIAMIEEVPGGVILQLSDGRPPMKVMVGDPIKVNGAGRDTKIITIGNPNPRNLRDVHDAGELPDVLKQMLEKRPSDLPDMAPATPVVQSLDQLPPGLGPPTGLPMSAGGTLGPQQAPPPPVYGGQGPMLPDMAGLPGMPPPPPGAPPPGGPGGAPPPPMPPQGAAPPPTPPGMPPPGLPQRPMPTLPDMPR